MVSRAPTTESVARTVDTAEAAGMRYCLSRRFLVSSLIHQAGRGMLLLLLVLLWCGAGGDWDDGWDDGCEGGGGGCCCCD